MNLINRDVFVWRDQRWRLLHTDPRGHAWVINTEDRNACPIRVATSELKDCVRERASDLINALSATSAHRAKAARDYALIQELLAAGEAIYDRRKGHQYIVLVAQASRRAVKTIQKLLRRYWQRGMTQSALLPDYRNCGRRENGTTGGRGSRPKHKEYKIYETTTKEDLRRFDAAIDYYFGDPRRTLKDAYNWLIENFYTIADGNGNLYAAGLGERPTLRQFTYCFKRKHSRGERLKRRHGDKTFSRDYRPKLSDIIADCSGAGNRYEIDASIADVAIALESDRTHIIGKPTVYFIVDRRSRPIVGFYVGLENPCWETTVEAIVSLVESKQEICEHYGVEYNPDDWPAHGLLPQEFLGDHGEMISRFSTQLAELGVSAANPSALLPNFKPVVETRFKLYSADLRNIAPGYEPSENRGKRRTQRYEKEVALTLRGLVAETLELEAIIKYNRRPLTEDPRSPDQIMRGVEPSPIGLWNDAVSQGYLCGRAFSEVEVRVALLPRENATITHEGLLFEDLYYTSDDAELIFPRNRGHAAKQLCSSLRTRPANGSRAWNDDVAGYRTPRSIRKCPGVLHRA